MSATFLRATAIRECDAREDSTLCAHPPLPPPRAPSPSFLPAIPLPAVLPNPKLVWQHGMREVDSFYHGTSTATGSQAVVLSSDGDTIITRAYEGDDLKVGIYSVAQGGAVRALNGHTDMICALSVDGDRLASGAADGVKPPA